MGSERQTLHIEEIAEAMGDAPFGSNLKNAHYTESGALVVQGKNVRGRSFDWSDKRHVDLEKWESLPRSQCKPGDLIFPKVGTIGKVGILSECEGYQHYLLSTNTMRLRVDSTRADSLFVYYFFTAPTTVNLIHALNSKSVQPVFNFTTLKRFQIELPPLPEQKAIAHILGTLDDKIELNRRMNATLEGMAQALFKSWFVDFDPVIDNALAAGNPIPDELAPRAEVRKQALANGTTQQGSVDHATLSDPKFIFPAAFEPNDELGWIPDGWSLQKISDVAHLTWGDTKVTKKSYTKEGFTAYSAKGPDGFLPYHDFDKVGIVISAIGSNSGQTFLAHGKWSCIKNTIRLWADDSDNRTFYLYHAVSAPLFWPLRGSAQPFISQTDARNCRLLYPTKEVADSFGATARALYEKAWDNESQNSNLIKLRETLLPKLISGEIDVLEPELSILEDVV